MADAVEIAAEVARLVNVTPGDPATLRAVQAAAQYVAVVEGIDVADVDDPAGSLPSDPLTVQGLVTFGRRMVLDPVSSPTGYAMFAGDPAAGTGYVSPEDVYAHVRHLFAHLARSWGVA